MAFAASFTRIPMKYDNPVGVISSHLISQSRTFGSTGGYKYLSDYVQQEILRQVFIERTCEAVPVGENSLIVFTVCVKSVSFYHAK